MTHESNKAMKHLFDQNLQQRILTGVIGVPIVLAFILISWQTTAILGAVMVGFMGYEYIHLVQTEPSSRLNNILFGISYLVLPMILGIALRRSSPDGLEFFLLALGTTWLTDSSAMVGGKIYGKHPFIPRISPKKTWEGVYSGCLVGSLGGLILSQVLSLEINFLVILLIITLPPVSIMGDLLESQLKRRFHQKDSGHLFPGHGGALDRLDSLLLSLPLTYILVQLLHG
jgi:phosphatidate cytidylyltransferase